MVSKCTKPRDDVHIMQNRIKEMLEDKDQETSTKILKKLLVDQASHVNFLSDSIFSALGQPPIRNSDSFSSDYSSPGNAGASESDENHARVYHSLAKRAKQARQSSRSSSRSLKDALYSSSSSDDEDFY